MANPLANATSWLYHLGDVNDARAAEIGAGNAGLVVIEQSDMSGEATRYYQPSDLATMRGDDAKTIVSYLSVGEAETYRDYWQSDWETTPPSWLDEANENWEGNIKVEYWNSDWKDIVFTMVDEVIDQGFDGVYLDIIDAFYHFEETAPDTGIDYRAEMVSFVTEIREHALERIEQVDPGRSFSIIGQNGTELVETPGYLDAIDGIGQEDLQFIYDNPENESEFQKQPDADFDAVLENLKLAEEADVEVFVVEYMTAARQTEYAAELEAELEALIELGIPMYLGEDRDLTEIYDQSAIQSDGTDDGSDGGTDDGTDDGTPPVEVVDQDIIGTSKADDLEGGAGDDFLSGKRGDDSVVGGAGDDELQGGKGMDELFGGAGQDVLSGNKGHDYIEGGDGDDLITGGKGHDELLGGEGADTFVFKGRFGSDIIKDFDVAEDELVLANNARFTVTELEEGVMLEFSNGASIEFEAVQVAEFEDFFFG